MVTIYQIGLILILGAIYLALRAVIVAYVKYRGARLVTCPENKEHAGVEVDTIRAAFRGTGQTGAGSAGLRPASALRWFWPGDPHLRLKECSRWPERRNCGQECLAQIEAAPEDCLVRNILTHWYQGKSCVYCHKPLEGINWADHKPALMSPEGITVEWRQVRPETVLAVLANHQPVCWNCHISETFRRKFPELVVDRDYRR
jgi:hypothetical protein